MKKVLSFGLAKELLAHRHAALAEYDFQVVSVSSKKGALDLVRREVFAAVIVGHQVPADMRNEVASVAKALHGSRVIYLYRGSIANAELADAVWNIDGPVELLAETVGMFIKHFDEKSVAAANRAS
jgi:hypothetical protein